MKITNVFVSFAAIVVASMVQAAAEESNLRNNVSKDEQTMERRQLQDKKNLKKKGDAPAPKPGTDDRSLPEPGTKGDPHFVMFSGEKYDFHGGCDLVLVQNPDFNDGEGLYIHIRTKIQRWWSYVDSAVLQIGNDTLEVMGGFARKSYFVNGQPGEPLDESKLMSFTIGGYPVRYRHLSEKSFQFKIFLENDQSIILKAVKDFMRVDIEHPTAASFEDSVGLMGSFETGKKLGRDGVTVFEDNNEFGKEWQVLRTEPMLFHNVEGVQHPETCAMPAVTQDKRRLEGSITREQAMKACSKVPKDERDDCVFDVMATNDLDMAGAY